MKHRNNLKRFLYLDFYYSVLRRDWRISTFLSDLVLKTVAVVIVSIDRFIKDASMSFCFNILFYAFFYSCRCPDFSYRPWIRCCKGIRRLAQRAILYQSRCDAMGDEYCE